MSVKGNGGLKKNRSSMRVLYNCSKCPAYCCSYDRVEVTKRDLLRIARHFGISYKQAEQRYTKASPVGRILRQKHDHVFKRVCEFLDSETRQCGIYDARPAVCRNYPDTVRCSYYDFLASERRRQCDPEFIPLV
jgi:Fe-S-cluster containining protein